MMDKLFDREPSAMGRRLRCAILAAGDIDAPGLDQLILQHRDAGCLHAGV